MDCEQVQQWLSPFMDGELSFTKARALQKHVNDCSDCSDRLIDRYKLTDQLNKHETPDLSDDFDVAVMSRIEDIAEQESFGISQRIGMVAMLLIGLALGTIMAMDVTRTVNQNDDQTEVTQQTSQSPPVAYRTEAALSEVDEESLAGRFVRLESAASDQAQQTTP